MHENMVYVGGSCFFVKRTKKRHHESNATKPSRKYVLWWWWLFFCSVKTEPPSTCNKQKHMFTKICFMVTYCFFVKRKRTPTLMEQTKINVHENTFYGGGCCFLLIEKEPPPLG